MKLLELDIWKNVTVGERTHTSVKGMPLRERLPVLEMESAAADFMLENTSISVFHVSICR